MKSRWIDKIFPFGGLPQAVYALIAAFFVKEPAVDQVERGGHRENEDFSGALRAFFSRPILPGFVPSPGWVPGTAIVWTPAGKMSVQGVWLTIGGPAVLAAAIVLPDLKDAVYTGNAGKVS